MPESPTWLLVKGRDEKAARALKQLGYEGERAEHRLAMIKLTLAQARKETDGATYAEWYVPRLDHKEAPIDMQLQKVKLASNDHRGHASLHSGLLRDFLDCGLRHLLLPAGRVHYKRVFPPWHHPAMPQCVRQCAFGECCADPGVPKESKIGLPAQWFMIERFGRRFLSLWGLVILTVLLFLTGGIACIGTMSANKAVTAFILFYCWLYNVTIGATAYVAMSEISTSRLRAKTAALALLFQSAWGTFWSFILPFIFNPDKASELHCASLT